jgi:hypothetical protein
MPLDQPTERTELLEELWADLASAYGHDRSSAWSRITIGGMSERL